MDENLYRIRAGGVWARDDRRGMFGVLERRDIRQLRANARSRLPHGPHGRTVGAGCPRLFPAPERIPARPGYPVGRQALQQAPTARRTRRRAGELRRFHPGSVGLSARRRPLLRGALPQPPLLRLLLGILAHLPRTIHKTLTIKAHYSMKRLFTKFMIGSLVLSVISSCNELSSPQSAESDILKSGIYYRQGNNSKFKTDFITEIRNGSIKITGFEPDGEDPYSAYEFTLWRFEKNVDYSSKNLNDIEYTNRRSGHLYSSIGYFYNDNEYDYYDQNRWDEKQLDIVNIMYKQKSWADAHEEFAKKTIEELLIPRSKKYIQEKINQTVKVIDWELNGNGQGDTFTSYLVTYEIIAESSNYALVNLIEFDDGKWNAWIEGYDENLANLLKTRTDIIR